MKKSLFSLFAIFSFALALSLTSCQQSDTAATSTADDNAGGAVMMATPNTNASSTTTMSLESPMELQTPQDNLKMEPCNLPLRDLKLSKAQMDSLKIILKNHFDCEKFVMDSLRASEKTILEGANAQRKAIMDQVKAGTLSKDSARKEITVIDKAAKQALKDNPVRAWALDAVKTCELTMLADFRNILTDAQKAKFDLWLAKKGITLP